MAERENKENKLHYCEGAGGEIRQLEIIIKFAVAGARLSVRAIKVCYLPRNRARKTQHQDLD
jgi:hypothetical protein